MVFVKQRGYVFYIFSYVQSRHTTDAMDFERERDRATVQGPFASSLKYTACFSLTISASGGV